MGKSITQDDLNNKGAFDAAATFFKRFHISSALKAANAYKLKGTSVTEIFQYLFVMVFTHQSMYMDMKNAKVRHDFGKDAVYRFLNMACINWIRFTTLLAARIISTFFATAMPEDSSGSLIIDDSTFSRDRSKMVELLARVYDHAHKVYLKGFRMLSLGWSDGISYLPLNAVLLSSENKKNRYHEAKEFDRRSTGYRRRPLAQMKGTEAMLELLKVAKAAKIPAKDVLFDSWFASPKTIAATKSIGYDVVAMIKKLPTFLFGYEGTKQTLTEIYKRNKKRRGRSRYLLSVQVTVKSGKKTIPAKVVYVRNRNHRKEYLCLISTDLSLSEEEIIQRYGRRWKIEVFFKVCKSYLRLSKECRSLSYDALSAHVAIVFTRYMMLSVENRESEDPCSLGELFQFFCDKLAETPWMQTFERLIGLFGQFISDNFDISEKDVDEMMDKFMSILPEEIKRQLKVA